MFEFKEALLWIQTFKRRPQSTGHPPQRNAETRLPWRGPLTASSWRRRGEASCGKSPSASKTWRG